MILHYATGSKKKVFPPPTVVQNHSLRRDKLGRGGATAFAVDLPAASGYVPAILRQPCRGDRDAEQGPFSEERMMVTAAWRQLVAYFIAIWEFRYFWMSLVKAELQRRYRRSILGLGWSLLQPVSMTLVLGMIYRGAFNISFWDFAPLLLTGLSFWNFFNTTVLAGCQSLVISESYIRQEPVPLAIFPLRTVLTAGFHFLISLSLAVTVEWFVHGPRPLLPMLMLLPTLVLLFVFGWAVALVAGFVHVYFPDTQHLAEVGLPILMFLTPVIWPPSMLFERPSLSLLIRFNPLAALLEMIRDPIMHGHVASLGSMGIAVAFIGGIVLLAMCLVARLERRIIFAM
jgi:ABC-type polysaccharide/polyol phosphate export permease